MSGVLGAYALSSKTNQAIYVNNKTGAAIVTVNLVNKNYYPVSFRIAISTNATVPLDSEYVEYDAVVDGKGVLERAGLAVGTGQYIVVYASDPNISAQVWGVEVGTEIPSPLSLSVNTSGSGPVWISPTLVADVYATNASASVRLQASDPLPVTYSLTSGSLPTGMSLNSTTGVISGTPDGTGYNVNGSASTFTITATNSLSNASAKSITITRKWYDGSNRLAAAPSAQYIKSLGITTDGNFWLQPSGCPRPFVSHCYNSIESGGWQLVLRFKTDFTPYWTMNQNEFLTAAWEGWNYTTQNDVEALGLSPVGTGDTDAFSPSFCYSTFTDIMVIANDAAQVSKRLGWRHTTPITNMHSVTGAKNSETVGNTVLFGQPANWLSSLYIRADTDAWTGGTRYGFKIRADTGASNSTRNMTGGFGGSDRFTDTTIAGHYYAMIGCGRENSNSAQWGGGIGGVYTTGPRWHKASGHWWNHGDQRNGSSDTSDCFYGHAVYIRNP